jgi:GAF domain-containing protein
MKCPRCEYENRAGAKFCDECGTPLETLGGSTQPAASYADVQRSLTEALARENATAEILGVIRTSPSDVQPVFEAIAQSAARLCGVPNVTIFLRDGDSLRLVAHHGPIPIRSSLPVVRGTANGRAVLDARTVHVADMQIETEEFPEGSENARHMGHRTVLCVPLKREGVAIGTIQLRRMEGQLFSERQVALLQTFADQAVIAIENVRLFNETKEALERQTATSEILRVIASSPADVQPVFETIVQSAQRLLEGHSAAVMLRIGDEIHLGAYTSMGETNDAEVRSFWPLSISTPAVARVFIDGETEQISDVESDPRLLEVTRTFARHRGWRSRVVVPMRRDRTVRGAIAVSRREPGPFSDEEIAVLKTFADQAVIAIENVRLFNETKEALERQTATSEILRVISSSPTDVQPVFDTIARNAVRVCDSTDALVVLVDGDETVTRAHYGDQVFFGSNRRPINRGLVAGRAVLEARPIQVADLTTAGDFPEGRDLALRMGHRTVMAVPLLRDGVAIGAILMRRSELKPFTDKQIALLQTFADQAVIAIENVRLFTELQASNRELTTALDKQTATSEILRVISQSQTDVQPVFEAIVSSALRLMGAQARALTLVNGDHLELAAFNGTDSSGEAAIKAAFPLSLRTEGSHANAIRLRAPVNIADAQVDPQVTGTGRSIAHAVGYRSMVAMPMLRHAVAVGTISATRPEPGGFTDDEIALLQTFADQAVIAIENVRLFTELQTSNRDLTTALDKQTATADILGIISRSQTDLQPVFDAILTSAVRLLRAYGGYLTRIVGNQMELVALKGPNEASEAAIRVRFPQSLQSVSITAQAIRDRTPLNIGDYEVDPRVSEGARVAARLHGYRSWVVVPILRHADPVGAILIARRETGGFTDGEIALLETFADQAVIAIENVRLFTELQARTGELSRSVGELRALGEVSQALSSTLDVDAVLDTIVTRANDLIGADGCTIFEYDEVTEQFHLRATRNLEPGLVELARGTPLRKGDQGILGHLPMGRQAVQVPDITVGSYSSPISDALIKAGYRAVVAVPLIREDHLIGALTMNRKTPGEFPAETIELLQTFATQSALAIQNARLFREIEQKSRELEAASRHKSEFLANMSHELRTPLNAVIGFSEVLTERMFGELNEKQEEYLKDIHASGQHLLSLINDILDLSKIEAGKMDLELSEFDLAMTIDNALMLVRERAARRSIALNTAVDERVGHVQADERKIRQVLLNLLSNAIKFTPEGGRIDVEARSVNESIEVSVTDTGVGIAPEDQKAVFEEFRQVGTADKKVEGTGLGLALSRKFIELHGGKIWVKSEVGAGSTFTFTVSVRHGEELPRL